MQMKLVLSIMAVGIAAMAAPTVMAKDSPWNGTWTLDPARSSDGAAGGAADAYRFTLTGSAIRWEIPSLGEVVTGATNGRPMVIRRHGLANGMTLSVTAPDPWTLRYRVSRNGKLDGGGVMMLVDSGKAWIDITWGPTGLPNAAELIYVLKSNRPGATNASGARGI